MKEKVFEVFMRQSQRGVAAARRGTTTVFAAAPCPAPGKIRSHRPNERQQALGLTSAWLSGGGEATTNRELSELLGYPSFMEAVGTIPIGYPQKDVSLRYRRPLQQVTHWNRYEPEKFRTQAQIDYYVERLRPFAMYRGLERMEEWEDCDEKLGSWKDAFTTAAPNPGGKLET